MTKEIPRKQYVELYGPTVGDKVRLGDTNLFIEVEKDFTSYGDEVVFVKGWGLILWLYAMRTMYQT